MNGTKNKVNFIFYIAAMWENFIKLFRTKKPLALAITEAQSAVVDKPHTAKLHRQRKQIRWIYKHGVPRQGVAKALNAKNYKPLSYKQYLVLNKKAYDTSTMMWGVEWDMLRDNANANNVSVARYILCCQ